MMDLAAALKEFVASFGVPFRVIMGYGKFTPFIIMLIAGMSFFYSNRARMREETKSKLASKLRDAGSRIERRPSAAELAAQIAPDREEKGTRKVLIEIAEFALKLAKFDRRATEEKLIQSGDRDPRAISRYILQRGAGMAIAPALGWFVFPTLGFTGSMQIVGALVCVLAGGILVDVRLDRALAVRRQKIENEFPVLLDLLTIYVDAGLSFDSALSQAGKALKASFPTASEEIRFLRQDLEVSVDRRKTFREFGVRLNNSTAQTFVSIILQSEDRGSPIGGALRTLAIEARKERIRNVERRAQKLPTMMQGPMFLFILPAIFLSVIGPAIIQIMIEFSK